MSGKMMSGGRALKLIPSICRASDRCRFLGLQTTPCARLEDRGTQRRGAPRSFVCAASTSSSGSDADVGIVVLAGGLTANGGVPKWVEGRLNKAAEFLDLAPESSVILVTGGGSPHKRPILFDKSGHVNHESTVCAKYLIDAKGVDPSKILKETSSYDTIGNAYFSLVIHALPLKWSLVKVVTSGFHMPRARAAFDWIYNSVESPPTLEYHSVEDQGMSDEALEARVQRELESARALEANARELKFIGDINTWMHTTHRCYAVARQDEWNEPTEASVKELETY